MLDGVIRKHLGRDLREQRQTVHAQPPRDVFSERDFARIGSTDGDVDIARVVDRAQNTGDGDAHGRALIALQSILVQFEVQRADGVPDCRQRMFDERTERSFALEPLLRGEHLERGGGEGGIVAGCCEDGEARCVGGGWTLLRWHYGERSSAASSCWIRVRRSSSLARSGRGAGDEFLTRSSFQTGHAGSGSES